MWTWKRKFILVSCSFCECLFNFCKTKTGITLTFLYISIFIQHSAPFLYLYYLCPSEVFLLTTHKICFHTLLITLWDLLKFLVFENCLSLRPANFLQISGAHVDSVVCITPAPSFLESSCFSRLCTFSFRSENLWFMSF